MTAPSRPLAGWPSRAAGRRLAVTLGVTGGVLGVAAGLIQALAGSAIPAWTGGKANPLPLGLVTIALSAVAAGAAISLRAHPPSPARCAAAAAGLLVPAGICFTTVGRLWYVPGALLLAATALAVLAGPPKAVLGVVRRSWLLVLVSALGGAEILLALAASPAFAALGLIGGILVIAAPWLARRAPRLAASLLIAGALPFALATWWSLVAPAVAVLSLAIGLPVVLSARHASLGARPQT